MSRKKTGPTAGFAGEVKEAAAQLAQPPAPPQRQSPLSRRSVMSLVKKIRAQQERIGKERDKLRDLVEEAAKILDHCDEAADDLERAADTLSQLV